MPITSGGGGAGSDPYAAIAASANGGNMPGITLPSIQTKAVDPGSIPTNNQSVIDLLSRNAPQSLTAALGPLLNQIYGSQNNLMKPIFDQQGAQGAAQATSDATKRGMTGSSIEAAGIGQAYTAANQGYNQYLAQMLQQLIPQYSDAAKFDISGNTNYYSNLAQAVGQGTAANQEMDMFRQQLAANIGLADKANKNALWAAGIGAVGNGAAAAIKMCDIRVKEDIYRIGEWRGLGVYAYRYKQDTGIDLPDGMQVGVLAHEVAKDHPEALSLHEKGYLMVDYKKLWEVASA